MVTVTKEQINAAMNVDLYTYLTTYHREDVEVSGDWARFRSDPSININKGKERWKDWSGKISVNGRIWLSPIDFLQIFYGLSFQDAVLELINNGTKSIMITPSSREEKSFELPTPDNERFSNTFSYLTKTRCIPEAVVTNLIKGHFIYQTTVHTSNRDLKNIIFVNKDQDYYEVHGTCSFGKSFHGVGKQHIDNYWMIKQGTEVNQVYVCEAAIDAISLFVLHCLAHKATNCGYISIGGCENIKTIHRIIKEYEHVTLAVDNDDAGAKCRNQFPDTPYILPTHKDWNEDLIAHTKKG